MQWYRKTFDEALDELGSRETGLDRQEAHDRLARYGPNALGGEAEIDLAALLLDQVKSPLIFILLIAAAVTLALGEYTDTAVILAVILFNGVIGFTQELKAEKNVRSLKQMVTPRALVVRGGREMEVDAAEVVPGDVVRLVSGAMVPADLRLFLATELRIDESMLTGESIPAIKDTDALADEDLTPGDQSNMAFMGTLTTSGRGRGVVVATGRSTLLGGIAREIGDIGAVRAPIQEKISAFAQRIGWIVLGAAALLFVLGVAVGESVHDMFMTAVAAAVATVPEGLPIVVTIALATGVARMARVGAIVRRLPAVETLGGTTVICSDKTGTLTVNEMTVRRIFDGLDAWEVSGQGYDPLGDIAGPDARPPDEAQLKRIRDVLRIGMLCNESRLEEEDGRLRLSGDPTEGALITSAMKAGLNRHQEAREYRELAVLPFESERGYMATLVDHGGERLLFVKGGPDRLLDICESCQRDAVDDTAAIRSIAADFAADGLRVLAMAYKPMPPDTDAVTDADVTHGLVFAGLQGMIDPPRAEAIAAVAGCHAAGIRVMMLTGDHADTAGAIAARLGIAPEGDRAVTGRELAGMDDGELDVLLGSTNVFARIAPEHKLRIVERLKAAGEVVAVTGDGVNDAPALKAAHLGVAMGRSGTDVAKESSDMVLSDDNFSNIFEAVREGRIVFDNLRKVVFFLIPTGIAAVWSILVTVLLGVPMPYLPAQLLWINLVTNGLQDVALAFEPGEPGVEKRPPRRPDEGIMNAVLVQRTVVVSLVIAAGVVLDYLGALDAGYPLEKARTLAVTVMVLFQFFQAWNARSETRSILAMNPLSNRFLFVSMGLALAAQVAFVYAEPLQWLFGSAPLALTDWAWAAATALSVVLVVEADKWLRRRMARA